MAKFYDKRTLNHEQAVAWTKQQIIGMGFGFNETHLEAGIDAFAELADPTTGAAQANFFGIQVKTCERFDAETPDKFSFYADGDDITYWLSSTIPVLLLVCRARTDEAYAVWVREYFQAPQNTGKKTVVFNKLQDRFQGGDDWQRRLINVGVPHSRGLSFPPVPKPELLTSNLLEVALPKTVYYATPKFKLRGEVQTELRNHSYDAHEFIIKGGLLWTVHSLYDAAWSTVVENLSIKPMEFRELAFHIDPAKRRYAVELLNLCLSSRLRRDDVFWFGDEGMYVYSPRREITVRVRKGFRAENSQRPKGLIFPSFFKGRMVRCRHLAIMTNFIEIGGAYFLQIDPTYYFTRDGRKKHPRWEDLIRTVRILQKERDYHSNLEVWREVLTQPGDLARPDYPFLSFKDYLRFESPVSIPDAVWRPANAGAPPPATDLDNQLSLVEQS